ncbi:MAG: YlcI/YnfO family protein [Acidimicrobiales bacterium]
MQLSPIVEGISDDLRKAGAIGGEETRAMAELLVASLEAAIGLRILDALHEAARELSASLPTAQVDVRLQGRDPVLSLTVGDGAGVRGANEENPMAGYADDELARLTLRLPEGLKDQVERAASRAGASINSWIVSAVARALETPPMPSPGRRMPRRMTGFVQG